MLSQAEIKQIEEEIRDLAKSFADALQNAAPAGTKVSRFVAALGVFTAALMHTLQEQGPNGMLLAETYMGLLNDAMGTTTAAKTDLEKMLDAAMSRYRPGGMTH